MEHLRVDAVGAEGEVGPGAALVLRGHLVGRVHVLERDVHEQRRAVGRVRLDGVDGAARVVGRRRVEHGREGQRRLAIQPEVRAVVAVEEAVRVVLGPGKKADVRREAAIDRQMVRRLVAQVALAEEVALVARAVAELLGERRRRQGQKVAAEPVAVGLHGRDRRREAAAEEGPPRRAAVAEDVVPLEEQAVFCERGDGRRRRVLVVERRVVPAQVVGEDGDEVRRF